MTPFVQVKSGLCLSVGLDLPVCSYSGSGCVRVCYAEVALSKG